MVEVPETWRQFYRDAFGGRVDFDADGARERHDWRAIRLQREQNENDARLAAKAAAKMQAVQALDPATDADAAEKERKRAIIAAAMERARAKAAAAASTNDTPAPNATTAPKKDA